jgi:hypothetical protein
MNMKRIAWISFAIILVTIAACSKPLAIATVNPKVRYVTREYTATPNDVYYAVRWALDQHGYALDQENLADGIVTSTWGPIRSDSHYVEMFNRPQYTANSAYYQLDVKIAPEGDGTKVKVGTRIKSLTSMLMSSGVEEDKVLVSVGDYLRTDAPDITNLGAGK